jgi:hypothetical protein
MLALLIFLGACLCAYGAYRAIRGGFARPQSERLSIYGVIGLAVLLMVAASLAAKLF